jgi:hypothetical protein
VDTGGELNAEFDGRQALLEERQEQAAATLLRQMAVSHLHAGADPEVLLRQIRDAARLADDGGDSAMASYLRAVAMVLNGEEPEDVPAAFRDHVEVVRKAVPGQA